MSSAACMASYVIKEVLINNHRKSKTVNIFPVWGVGLNFLWVWLDYNYYEILTTNKKEFTIYTEIYRSTINSQTILQATREIHEFGRLQHSPSCLVFAEHHPKVEDSWRSWEPQRECFFLCRHLRHPAFSWPVFSTQMNETYITNRCIYIYKFPQVSAWRYKNLWVWEDIGKKNTHSYCSFPILKAIVWPSSQPFSSS